MSGNVTVVSDINHEKSGSILIGILYMFATITVCCYCNKFIISENKDKEYPCVEFEHNRCSVWTVWLPRH